MKSYQDPDYDSLEEELYKYGKIFMEMNPALFLVTLCNVAARIIIEQSKDDDAENLSILIATSQIAKMVKLKK